LRVISRLSMMPYKGIRKPLSEIGRELKVDAVLTGSVVRSGEDVRITVQLIEAATDQICGPTFITVISVTYSRYREK
jgi:TolB-like protein